MTPPHIPDDELHAYLDQALPRSRCVTLESHLAACPGCRARRDATAALRDQTTLLLAQLTPERKRIPPSYEELQRRAAARPSSPLRLAGRGVGGEHPACRRRRLRLAHVGPARAIDGHDGAAGGSSSSAAAAGRCVGQDPRVAEASPGGRAARRPGRRHRLPRTRRDQLAFRETLPSPRSSEISTDTLPPETAPAVGLWRTVPWTEAESQMGGQPPRVDGVPVVEVQVQPSRDRARETPVTVVAQQLASGQLITTIEGPVDDVWALLSRRGDGGDTAGAETVRQGTRLLAVTGQLPADSLRAMVRRVNAARRVQ